MRWCSQSIVRQGRVEPYSVHDQIHRTMAFNWTADVRNTGLESAYNHSNITLTRQNPRLRDIRENLLTYVLPLIIFTGTVGNALSFIVLVRRRMRVNSVYFYLAALACADTMVLYVSAFRYWVSRLTGFDLLRASSASCKITIFLIMFSQHMSAWLIGLLTFDRFISVWMPFRAAYYCTIKRARTVTGVLLAIMVLYNSYVFFTFDLHPGTSRPMCTIRDDNPFRMPFEYLKTTTYVLAPSVVVLVLNACIMYRVLRQRTPELQQVATASRGKANPHVVRQKNRVTVMLLVVSFAWLMLTTPYGLLSVIPVTVFDESREFYLFLRIVCFLLFYLNHSVNFFLYCLTGMKFRHEFLDLFSNLCRCERFSFGRDRSTRTQRTPLFPSGDVNNAVAENGKCSVSPSDSQRVLPENMLAEKEKRDNVEIQQLNSQAMMKPVNFDEDPSA